jgi:FtsP/CotA-like multicopper oxidase with cupredoxin domain
VAAALALGLAVVGWIVYAGAKTSTVGRLDFENALRIPPVLWPRVDGAGRRVFDLDLRAGRSRLLPGTITETWGVNGPHLGPTLRASRGDEVLMRVRNGLPEATTLHWHGMHLPAVADGGPHQTIAPGATWAPSWRIEQPAATLWYHPHQMGRTADHVYRGVAGLFILDDPETELLALPRDYGVDDIPLVIQDARLSEGGALDLSRSWISPAGRLGDTILLNGTYDPHLEIARERVRFRLLNASGARIYHIGFADEREFDLIATDGGLLERPVRLDRVQLSPGERAEIVARFTPGERAVLRSFEPDLGAGFFQGRFAGADDSFDLLQIRAASRLAPSPQTRGRLAPHVHLHEDDVARTRRFVLDGRSINGRKMDMRRIDQVVERGATEIWEVHNGSGTPHNFHPHGISFRVLPAAGGPPPPALRGWKDTIYIHPGETVRLLARFTDHADPGSPYMFHCHLLEHEDSGMMGQFVVVAPGHGPDLGHDGHPRAGARGSGP